MNRAIFFLAAIVVALADDNETATFALKAQIDFDGPRVCPPCNVFCVYGTHCVCGRCVPNGLPPTPNIIVDCIHGYSYDYVLKKCVAVTCDAPDACPRNKRCVPHNVVCVRDPCPQFQCLPKVPSCHSCAVVKCAAGYHCKCGKCVRNVVCPSCAAVLCPANSRCKCGRCIPFLLTADVRADVSAELAN